VSLGASPNSQPGRKVIGFRWFQDLQVAGGGGRAPSVARLRKAGPRLGAEKKNAELLPACYRGHLGLAITRTRRVRNPRRLLDGCW